MERKRTKGICRPALDHSHTLLEEGIAVDGDEEGAGEVKGRCRSALRTTRCAARRLKLHGADDRLASRLKGRGTYRMP